MRNSDGECGCWNWTAGNNRHGYGRLNVRDRKTGKVRCLLAHRVAYAVFNCPEGMTWWEFLLTLTDEIDHTCVRPGCINPDHLELVTRAEQLRRRDERRGDGQWRAAA